jgi:hypothetical protein
VIGRPVRRGARLRGEQGSALVLALLFLSVCGITVGGLLTYANASSASTTALRSSRGSDYNAIGAMQAAIATVRVGATCSNGVSNGVYVTPPASLNNPPAVVLRVDCFPQLATTTTKQRNDVLSVCPNAVTVPCPDTQSLLTANVIFYDSTTTFGVSVGILTWSTNQ